MSNSIGRPTKSKVKTNTIVGIYRLYKTGTTRSYIGQSTDIVDRNSKHIRNLNDNKHQSPMLQNTWNKHGKDVFKIQVLWEIERGKVLEEDLPKVLSAMEDYYMWIYRQTELPLTRSILSWKPFYNVDPIAKTRLGSKNTPESNERHRLMLTQRHKDNPHLAEESRQRMLGNTHGIGGPGCTSPEHAQKISAATKGRIGSCGNRGKVHTQEWKAKMSEIKKKQYEDGLVHPMSGKSHKQESNEANRLAHTGKKVSEETKAKMKKSHAKRLSTQPPRIISQETRECMRQSRLNYINA